MRVAIHQKPEIEDDFALSWINYCQQHDISYEIVDSLSPGIIERLRHFDALLWRFSHFRHADFHFGRHVLYAAQEMGLKVFPDFKTCWHFDDKVAQTYLLTAVRAPFAKSWIFYNKQEAFSWLEKEADYPLVAKIRRGAASIGGRLIPNFREAKKYTQRMFGRGIPLKNSLKNLVSISLKKKQRKKQGLKEWMQWLWKRRSMITDHLLGTNVVKEKNYVYFQQFIPNDGYDVRVVVVGDKAWCARREAKKGDFRASGSGSITRDYQSVPKIIIKDAFETTTKIQTKSGVFDFIVDKTTGKAFISEISYAFPGYALESFSGYFDRELHWHEEKTNIAHEIIAQLLKDAVCTAKL